MNALKILVVSILFTCCQKEDNINYFNDLKGTWYNTYSDFDAIIFQSEDSLERKNLKSGSINHYYDIQIKSDEIILQYTGWDRCYVPISRHKYYLNESKDTLMIEDLSQYYPNYEGNIFSKTEHN
jgi:hypothetical protein